ncbi:MAG: MFS transporter [Candidatus Solibacter sp.]
MLLGGLTRNRDFLKLWSGQAISKIGSAITSIGIPLAAATVLGATPWQMGVLTGASGAGVLVFGLFAGAWADRIRRRPIMIAADLGRAALLATIPLAAMLHQLGMPQLYVVATLAGALTVVFDTSYQAYIPSLVGRGELVEANSKLALTGSIADVTGPGLTGLLVQLITAPIAILIDAGSFLLSAVSLWAIRSPEPLPSPPDAGASPDILREIAEGLRAAWRNDVLRALLLRAGLGAFSLGFIGGLYFLFAIRDLHLTAISLGIVVSVGGASSLLGALVAERVQLRFGVGRALIGAAWLTAASMVLVPLARGPVVVSAAFLIASQLGDMAWPVYMITETSLMQSITPDHLLGRVSSAVHLLFQGAVPLGAVAGGALAEVIGIRATMFAGSFFYLLVTLWFTFSAVRDVREMPVAPVA